MKTILILLVLCMSKIDFSVGTDEEYILDAEPLNCTKQEVLCSCEEEKSIYFCMNAGDEPQVIGKCPDDKPYCNVNSPDMCDKEQNSDCMDDSIVVFECTSDGMFPSPIHMENYFICVNEEKDGKTVLKKEPFRMECPKGFCYDPLTTFCNLRKENKECVRNPQTLKCPTFHGPEKLTWHPNMYYMCVIDPVTTPNTISDAATTYHPEIFKCIHGGVWGVDC